MALVLDHFTAEEFRRWLRFGPDADIVPELPDELAADAAVVDRALGGLSGADGPSSPRGSTSPTSTSAMATSATAWPRRSMTRTVTSFFRATSSVDARLGEIGMA